jgi:FOG: LysM repeat
MSLKKSFIMKAFLFTMLIIFCLVFVSKIVTATSSNEGNTKMITNIQVEKNDTLWNIASIYYTEEYTNIQDYIKEIKACNGLVSDTIYTGQHLIIPYFEKTQE